MSDDATTQDPERAAGPGRGSDRPAPLATFSPDPDPVDPDAGLHNQPGRISNPPGAAEPADGDPTPRPLATFSPDPDQDADQVADPKVMPGRISNLPPD